MVQNDKVKKIIKHRLALSIGMLMATSTLVLSSSAFALEALDDQSLKDVTGEGIAFTLSDFSMQYKGADDSAGTGYTRIIPVGPLSQTIDDYNVAHPTTKIGKADVWLYGLSISGNDGDSTKQFSGNTVNIGTADNPWLISVNTLTTPNFAGVDSSLSILGIEAPLLTNLLKSDGTLLTTDPNSYDLKLGTWADAFVRDPSKTENLTATGDQFGLNSIDTSGNRYINGVSGATTLRENRLRLQAIINGVSLNGTNLKLFQTLDGANTALGSDFSSYNNTLGLALTARINSGESTAASGFKGTLTDNTVETTGNASAWNNVHGGWNTTLNAAQTGGNCGNGGGTNTAYSNTGSAGCQYMVQNRTRVDGKTRTRAWTLPTGINNHVLRLSTQEKGTTQDVLSTPAINGGNAPTFADNDGLFLYKPNINLVIGSQWQPVVVGVAADGKNLTLEVTRIPNVANVYKQIYTDYTGADASYKGGTCSIYWCGGAGNGNSTNATHSSITIGSTVYTAPVNTGTKKPLAVTAYTGADAIGVSFGALENNTLVNSTTANLTEVRYKQRQLLSETWRSASLCTSQILGNCTGRTDQTGTLQQWQYNNGSGVYSKGATAVVLPGNVTQCSTAFGNGNGSCSNVSPAVTYDGTTYAACPNNAACTRYGTNSNRNWTYANSLGGWVYERTTANTDVNTLITAANGMTGVSNLNLDNALNQAATPVVNNPMPLNNLGSAVIDGMLIQHMKITTKGL